MNILFLAQFPIDPTKGGVQRVTSILSKEFQILGHDVLFCSLTNNKTDDLILSENQYHVNINTLEDLSQLITELSIHVVINQAGVYPEITKVLKHLRNTSQGLKILTVHHNCIACLNERYKEIILGNPGIANKVLRFIGNPLLWSVLRYRNRMKYKRLFQESVNVSDQLVLLAESYISELTALGVDTKGKVQAISNPASFAPQSASLAHKENRIVFVGRLSFTQKRVDKLMDVIARLHHTQQNWHFDIVGDGAQREWMQEYKSNNKLGRVYFHGYTEPAGFLEKAKISLLTSDFEGFPMVIQEAQAYGVVPVVNPCFSAVHEVVGKNAGIVLKDSKSEFMIKAVDDLIDAPAKLEALARGALGNDEKFNPAQIASKWIELIERLPNEK